MHSRSSPSRKARNQWRRAKHGFIKSLSGWLAASRGLVPHGLTSPSGVTAPSKTRTASLVGDDPLGHGNEDESDRVSAQLHQALGEHRSNFGLFASSCFQRRDRTASSERCRDIYPLPLIEPSDSQVTPLVLRIANWCVIGLNHLHTGCSCHTAPDFSARPTLLQRYVYSHVLSSSCWFLKRFQEIPMPSLEHSAFEGLLIESKGIESKPSCKHVPLIASQVDLPTVAGSCDPEPPSLRAALDPDKCIFHEDAQARCQPPLFFAGNRVEYVRLTARSLVFGKLRLMRSVSGGGGVSAVPKSSLGSLREVWRGNNVSDCADRPPKPQRHATPAC